MILCLSVALAAPVPAAERPPPLAPIAADRVWQVLPAPTDDRRAAVRAAGEKLGGWTIQVAGVTLDGPTLTALADTAPEEPFLRVVREALRRPFDLDDLLYLLDDVLVAGEAGRRGEPFFVTAGRARGAGVLVHPDDVWGKGPRRYPEKPELAVDEPPPQESFPVAADGEVLGPNWTMRYRSPDERDEMWRTLAERRPEATFSSRLAALVAQLEQQGAEVYLTSFLRYRERGYLMWGAFLLRGCKDAACVSATVTRLEAANRDWAGGVPIRWSHPDGWEATREAARQMADAYDVVYATEKGARYSNHYDGTAADLVATGLPRSLTLLAPDGAQRTFDLSDPAQTRDLSLTPDLIAWVEAHWDIKKLKSDYPHWDDAAP